MITIAEARQNRLLGALSEEILLRWLPHLEWMEMPLGAVLNEPGEKADFVCFPAAAIVSLHHVLADGDSAEIAVVGQEGAVGIFEVMGDGTATSRASVQSGGQGIRMPAAEFKREFNRAAPVLHLMLRFALALITQIAQMAVCNRHHPLDQQLCRLLLLSLDRLHGDELILTQELIAKMLGVRREAVHEVARKLQNAGLIHYSRGHIHVLERKELERRSCECYAAVKREYDRLLPGMPAR